ncbi:MAG: porin family protein [Bacteroidetes bacterium]|nr:porin family protein [Bacteroidota bacterium]
MKKILLIFAIAMLSTELSFGQFALGVKIGYNANKLSTNLNNVKSQFNSGFHFGLFTHIGKRLYVAPELLYTMSGAVFDSSGNVSATGWKQKITMGSLDIPVLLGFKIIHSDIITWRIEVGPEVSFIVNSKVKDLNSFAGPITTANLAKANWYVLGGSGIDFLFMSFDIRYSYGLNQLIKSVNSEQFDTKNGMFLVSLGFRILGSK